MIVWCSGCRRGSFGLFSLANIPVIIPRGKHFDKDKGYLRGIGKDGNLVADGGSKGIARTVYEEKPFVDLPMDAQRQSDQRPRTLFESILLGEYLKVVNLGSSKQAFGKAAGKQPWYVRGKEPDMPAATGSLIEGGMSLAFKFSTEGSKLLPVVFAVCIKAHPFGS